MERRKLVMMVFGLSAIGSGLLCGCGDGGDWGPPARPGMVEKLSAVRQVRWALDMKAALDGNDGATVADIVTSIGLDGANFVRAPTMNTGAIRAAVVVPGPNGGTVDCTTAGCVYHGYTTAAASVYDGTVSVTRSGDTCTAKTDLTLARRELPAEVVRHDIDGSIVISSTRLDGTFRSTGAGSAIMGEEILEYRYFNLVIYDEVLLSDGEPVGGSIYGKWSDSLTYSFRDGSVTTELQDEVWDGTAYFP